MISLPTVWSMSTSSCSTYRAGWHHQYRGRTGGSTVKILLHASCFWSARAFISTLNFFNLPRHKHIFPYTVALWIMRWYSFWEGQSIWLILIEVEDYNTVVNNVKSSSESQDGPPQDWLCCRHQSSGLSTSMIILFFTPVAVAMGNQVVCVSSFGSDDFIVVSEIFFIICLPWIWNFWT